MPLYKNNGGVNLADGTTIANDGSNTGGGADGSALGLCVKNTGTVKTSRTAPLRGVSSYNVVCPAADTAYLGSGAFDEVVSSVAFVGTFRYNGSIPGTAAGNLFQLRDDAGVGPTVGVRSTDQKVNVQGKGGTSIGSTAGVGISTAALIAGHVYELEVFADTGTTDTATDGPLKVRLRDLAAPSVYLLSTDVLTRTGDGPFTEWRMGKLTSAQGAVDLTIDTPAWQPGATGLIGPVDEAVTNVAPSASLGADVSSIEPYSTVPLPLTLTDSDGTVTSFTVRQVPNGSPAVTLTGSGSTLRSYIAPGTVAGCDLVFGLTAVDNDGASSGEDLVTHHVLPVTETAIRGGIEVPVRVSLVTT